MVECIDNVKEVGLSCERKIKELKVYTASIANIEILLNAIIALFCMGGSKEQQSHQQTAIASVLQTIIIIIL